MFEELLKIFEECREPNWDGYRAQAVREETYHLAHQFLAALPLGTPVPSVDTEPDGNLTFEWYRSPRRTLSVSVSPAGDLHYAALIRSAKAYGTEPFFGELTKAIGSLIQRVTNE
jgi:hypothetical protein